LSAFPNLKRLAAMKRTWRGENLSRSATINDLPLVEIKSRQTALLNTHRDQYFQALEGSRAFQTLISKAHSNQKVLKQEFNILEPFSGLVTTNRLQDRKFNSQVAGFLKPHWRNQLFNASGGRSFPPVNLLLWSHASGKNMAQWRLDSKHPVLPLLKRHLAPGRQALVWSCMDSMLSAPKRPETRTLVQRLANGELRVKVPSEIVTIVSPGITRQFSLKPTQYLPDQDVTFGWVQPQDRQRFLKAHQMQLDATGTFLSMNTNYQLRPYQARRKGQVVKFDAVPTSQFLPQADDHWHIVQGLRRASSQEN
jgi:hypothetical protein